MGFWLWLHWGHRVQWVVGSSFFELGSMQSSRSHSPFRLNSLDILKVCDLTTTPFVQPDRAAHRLGTSVCDTAEELTIVVRK